MLKVMTIVGTRPEIIRLSRVIARLDRHFDHVLVHTGQNYDYELNEVFFDGTGHPPPDHSWRQPAHRRGDDWPGDLRSGPGSRRVCNRMRC